MPKQVLHFDVLICDLKTYPISDNKTGHVHHAGYEKALNNAVENYANIAINLDLIDKSQKFVAFFAQSS